MVIRVQRPTHVQHNTTVNQAIRAQHPTHVRQPSIMVIRVQRQTHVLLLPVHRTHVRHRAHHPLRVQRLRPQHAQRQAPRPVRAQHHRLQARAQHPHHQPVLRGVTIECNAKSIV